MTKTLIIVLAVVVIGGTAGRLFFSISEGSRVRRDAAG